MAPESMLEYAVFISVDDRACAFPLDQVVETMRSLPVESIAGAPIFVRGLSIIRGDPVPVVDLGTLLGGSHRPRSRLVTIRAGERRVALEVDEVHGVRPLDRSGLRSMPALLTEARPDLVRAVGALDSSLLLFLTAARILPEGLDVGRPAAESTRWT